MSSLLENQNPNIVRVLDNWDEVPNFQNASEEMEYWCHTGFSTSLIQSAIFTPEGSDSTTITLRMDPRMLARVKRLARQRYLNYQSMIKQWLAERMEKELRGDS